MSPPPAPSQEPVRPSSPSRPPADPVLQQRAWAAIAMALISLFGMAYSGGNIQRGVYVIAVAVVISLGALWLATTAMKRARRIGSSRPRGAVFAVILGVIGMGFGVLVLVGCALFWPQLTRYSQCESGASTISAQQACYQQMRNSLTNAISRQSSG